jgi:hypothetical protein
MPLEGYRSGGEAGVGYSALVAPALFRLSRGVSPTLRRRYQF